MNRQLQLNITIPTVPSLVLSTIVGLVIGLLTVAPSAIAALQSAGPLPQSKGGTGAASLTAAGIPSVATANTWALNQTTNRTAQNSTAETLAQWKVADDATGSATIFNYTTTDSVFIPVFRGISASTNTAVYWVGRGTTDSGSAALSVFQSQIGTSTASTTRPLFDWNNATTRQMRLTAAGALSVTGGTSPGISTTGGLSGASLAIGSGTSISKIKHGTASISSGTVTVTDSSITTSTLIFATTQTLSSGTPGALYCSARNAGTDFTITSSSNTENGTIGYLLIEP